MEDNCVERVALWLQKSDGSDEHIFGDDMFCHQDSGGYLSMIQENGGATHHFEYQAGGLLAAYQDPNGNRSEYNYDPYGRLIRAQNQAQRDAGVGFAQSLERDVYPDNQGSLVTHQSAEGVETDYENCFKEGSQCPGMRGADSRFRVRNRAGWENNTYSYADGRRYYAYADGTEMDVKLGSDIQWGPAVPRISSKKVQTPSGLSMVTYFEQHLTQGQGGSPLNLLELHRYSGAALIVCCFLSWVNLYVMDRTGYFSIVKHGKMSDEA